MKISELKLMTGGWFIGDFEPTLLRTKDFEIAIKRYKAGDEELAHIHKVAMEYTAVVSGVIAMNNQIVENGKIVTIAPNEVVHFKAISDSITVVVKTPSVIGDKYIVGE